MRFASFVPSVPRFAWLRCVGAVAVAALCAAAWIAGTRRIAADLLFSQVEFLTGEKARLETAGQSLPGGIDLQALARAMTARAVELDPHHALALVAQARDLFKSERPVEALEPARRADRLLTTPETLNQIGSILLRLGQDAAAREVFMKTLVVAPTDREALERLVSIAQTDRDAMGMLARLRELSGFYYYLPNTAYLWAQFWTEIAKATKSPLYYAAGRRAAGLAHNRPVPAGYALFYDDKDMAMHYNYFMMGARGMDVPDTGEVFQPQSPVDVVGIGLKTK